jgi:CelD/BcsL family acetyltransferase involved in cellulose biosynthesis
VALARREYEAWFLAAIESLRGQRRIAPDAAYAGDPEVVRDAKGAVSRFMPRNAPYVPATDQVALSAQFDLGQAHRHASSFRKLVKELHRMLCELGRQPLIPPDWTTGS